MNNQPKNQSISFGTIITIILILCFFGLMFFFVIYPLIKNKKVQDNSTGGKSAIARINLGLEVYKNYFNMNQLPLPENGTYFNVYYNQYYY